MTDMETRLPPYLPTGRPVRRFVAALVVLGVLFGALWLSGLVAPRLGEGSTWNGDYNLGSGRASITFDLHNKSLVAVEVRGVTMGGGQVTVASLRVNGHDISASGQKVAGGGNAAMEIEFTCRPAEGDGRPPGPHNFLPLRLEITVRTPIGIERSRTAGTFDLPRACLG